MALSVSPTTCSSGVVFAGDQWMIEIWERCLPIWIIETNSLIVCQHWLGSRSTEKISWNLCIDSVHLDKHEDTILWNGLFNLLLLHLTHVCMIVSWHQWLQLGGSYCSTCLMMFTLATENTWKWYLSQIFGRGLGTYITSTRWLFLETRIGPTCAQFIMSVVLGEPTALWVLALQLQW